MKTPISILKLIDAYLDGQLSDAEQISFEQQLDSNSELNSLVEESKLLRTVVENASLFRLGEQIQNDLQKIPYISSNRKSFSNKKWFLITGLITLCLFLAFMLNGYLNDGQTKSPLSHRNTYKLNNTTAQPIESISNKKGISEKSIKRKDSPQKTKTIIIYPKNGTTPDSLQALADTAIFNDTTNHVSVEETEYTNDAINTYKQAPLGNTDSLIIDTIKDSCIVQFNLEIDNSYCYNDLVMNNIILYSKLEDNVNSFSVKTNHLIHKTETGILELDSILNSGQNTLEIFYNNSCSSTVNIPEVDIDCNEEIRSTSFNSLSSDLELDLLNEYDKEICIIHSDGYQVYKKTHNGLIFSWNGRNQDGKLLPIGSYLMIIKYINGKVEQLEIDIIR